MEMQKELEERLKHIADHINSKNGEPNMNTMLAPEVCGLDAKAGTSRIRFRPMDWEKNQRGEMHGGAVAAMFDTAIGMTIGVFSDTRMITTTDLSVSYIRPFLGTSYLFNVEIIHMGRRLARARSTAVDEATGKTLATATASFMYIERK